MSRGSGKNVKQYMLVSNDIYELPLSWPMSLREMAEYTGMKPNSIVWATSPSGIRRTNGRKRHSSPFKVIGFYWEEGAEDDS